MKAFVKTNNKCFSNINFYLAWDAFNQMGYEVTLFDENEIPTLDISVETPVFAGISIFRKIIDKLEIDYKPFNCYPDILKEYYGRTIKKSTLGEERKKFHVDNIPIFVKPVLPKQFNGKVWNTTLQLIPLANIPDDANVWVCEPIKIQSEFRCYVNDGKILGVKHYYGDWSIVPDKDTINTVISNYKNAPISYGIDFAVTSANKTIVLEVNDGCNLGNYGIDSIHYGEMIVDRWYEIVQQGGKSNVLKQRLNPYFDNTTIKS